MVYDIDSIKQRNRIRDVITAHGLALRDSGSHLVGHCPFHEDEHPSFAVYPETRSFCLPVSGFQLLDKSQRAGRDRPAADVLP